MDKMDDCPEAPGIYAFRCSVNGKVYIGSSKNVKQRLLAHWNMLHGNYHKNGFFQQDYLLYGDNAFNWCVLSLVDIEQQANIEWQWIKWFDATNPQFGYNKTEWAVGVSGATKD